ncbi:MAG: AsmA family protein [Bacteroidales bacterium]|nr:AsmA family protein [Bacteroidales bacterium]
MKKVFKFLGIVVVLLIVSIIAVPFLFRDKIEAVVKQEINALLDAKVDYSDFSLSIFSSFPDLRAGLEKVSVIGKNNFEGDTLAYIGSLAADVKIMPLLDGKLDINSLLVSDAVVRAIVAADSTANWDIYKSEPDTTVSETADTTALSINLTKVRLTNADIMYIDSTANLVARVAGTDLDFSGKLEGDLMDANIALEVASLGLEMNNISYLKKSTVDFDANIDADLENMKFTFKENTLNFSGIPLSFDGYAQLKDSSTVAKIRLAASETSFRTLLALIPESIMKDVEGLKMDGTFELYADVDGEYIDMDNIPALDIAFKVNNGLVKYPDLPKSLDDINIDLAVKNPGGKADLTTIDVNKLHFELSQNPFDATLNLIKPMSNPTFKAKVNGAIDLNSLRDALPLDSMTIAGFVKANISVATDMASIEKEDYENVKAEGTVVLNSFSFESSDFPQGVNISDAKLVFTPKYLQLDPLNAVVGKSDFDVKGKVESYLPYLLSDGTIHGTVSLKSNLIDCNELMGDAPADTTSTAATTAEADSVAGAIIIPKNINFSANVDVKKVIYDRLKIKDMNGGVVINNGIAKLQNLKLNLCDGEIGLTGTYNTQNEEKPKFDLDIAMKEIELYKLTNSFSVIDSMMPIAKKTHGKVSISMNLKSDLDATMSPILKTMNGNGSFKSSSLSLKDTDFQKKLIKVLGSDKFNSMVFNDFGGKFTIESGNIVLVPFDVKLFNKRTTFSGSQGLDKTMNYLMSVPVTRDEVAKLVGKVGIKMPEGDDLPVGVKIGGTLSDPKLSIDTEALTKAVAGEVKSELKDKAVEATDKLAEKLKSEIKDEKAQKAVDEAKNVLNKLLKKKK